MHKKKSGEMLSDYFFLLKFILKNEPFLLPMHITCHAAVTLPWTYANVILLRQIINLFLDGADPTRIFGLCAWFAVFLAAANILNALYCNKLLPVQKERLLAKLYTAIYEKAADMDIAAYDDPKFYNDFVQSMNTMGSQTENMIELTKEFCGEILCIGAAAGAIAVIDPICLLLIALCAAVTIPLSRLDAKVRVQRTEAMMPLDRKNLYYWRVFYLADYAKELRLNPFGTLTARKYAQNITDRLTTIRPFLKKQSTLYFCTNTLPNNLFIYLAMMLYMGYRVLVQHQSGAGDFAAAFNAATDVSRTVVYLAVWTMLNFRENALYTSKFKAFMRREKKIKNGEKTTVYQKPPTVRFHDVSFTYPGNSEPTLKHINLEIKPNSKIALVGYNGSGKTTLTNLLLRLYDVTEGSITVDGEDIRSWDLKSYHKNFAAVFQDYSLFGATVGENVAMSPDVNKVRATKALTDSGLTKELPRGTDTVLLREFDENGLQLSGGEAQKTAIARAFYKNCAFAVLDEPSANLDPKAEYQLNDAIIRAARNKTVFFISHRLSTTVAADQIYMMENGEIVEKGTHEELMRQNGKYAYMFRLQAKKYNDKQNGAKI